MRKRVNRIERRKKASLIFESFLEDCCDSELIPDHRLKISDFLHNVVKPEIVDEANRASFEASLSYMFTDTRMMCLYLSLWLFLGEKVDPLFDDATSRKYSEDREDIINKINGILTSDYKDKMFRVALRKIIIHLDGCEVRH